MTALPGRVGSARSATAAKAIMTAQVVALDDRGALLREISKRLRIPQTEVIEHLAAAGRGPRRAVGQAAQAGMPQTDPARADRGLRRFSWETNP